MNTQELTNAILLRESGELSPEKTAELDSYLEAHPDALSISDDVSVLQEAGRFASRHTIPPVSDTTLESIRRAAESTPTARRTPWLALAAGLLLLFSFIPFLSPPSSPPVVVDRPLDSAESSLWASDEVSDELDALQQEIAAWSEASTWELLQMEDEAYWAERLLNTNDSI